VKEPEGFCGKAAHQGARHRAETRVHRRSACAQRTVSGACAR